MTDVIPLVIRPEAGMPTPTNACRSHNLSVAIRHNRTCSWQIIDLDFSEPALQIRHVTKKPGNLYPCINYGSCSFRTVKCKITSFQIDGHASFTANST